MVRLFEGDLVVDLFAGGGGASVGIERALGRSPDIAINHDKEAIEMHRVNHPGTKHYIENVWRVDPRKVCGAKRIAVMWLSPDCKHFSKAKGGKPHRSKKIRSLANVAIYWAKALGAKRKPRIIVLENVEEFQTWGPLIQATDERGRPILNDDGTPVMIPCPARKGLLFRRFVRQLQKLGYEVDWQELVAADYGAPTSRKRLFLIARCDGLPIVWPEPTHGPGRAQPWRTAAECIDWTLACPSIFERARPLAENTQRRIARGIEKFVKKDPFIVPVAHAGDSRVHGIDEPLRTVTGAHRGEHALVTPFVAKHYGGDRGNCAGRVIGVDAPLGTVTTSDHHALVAPVVARIGQQGSNGDHVRSAEAPLSTVTTKAEHLLVAPVLAGVGGRMGQSPERSVERPLHTVTSKGDTALVASYMVRTAHGDVGPNSRRWGQGELELGDPLPTVTASKDFALVAGFLKPRYGEDKKRNGGLGQEPRCLSVERPMPTVVPTANGGDLVATFLAKHNAGERGGATGQGLERPVDTVTARDTKALIAATLVCNTSGNPATSPEQPLKTVTSGGHHMLAASSLVKLKGSCRDGQPVTVPLATVAAQGNHFAEVRAFLMKYHRDGGQHGSLKLPMPTVVANDSLALVTVGTEQYAIVDIGMRMLQPRELFRSHDFPDDYRIEFGADGKPMTKEAQVRMCGNSVPPPMAEAILRANVVELYAERVEVA